MRRDLQKSYYHVILKLLLQNILKLLHSMHIHCHHENIINIKKELLPVILTPKESIRLKQNKLQPEGQIIKINIA